MKYCSSCGQKLNEGVKFCAGCVAKITDEVITKETPNDVETKPKSGVVLSLKTDEINSTWIQVLLYR